MFNAAGVDSLVASNNQDLNLLGNLTKGSIFINFFSFYFMGLLFLL